MRKNWTKIKVPNSHSDSFEKDQYEVEGTFFLLLRIKKGEPTGIAPLIFHTMDEVIQGVIQSYMAADQDGEKDTSFGILQAENLIVREAKRIVVNR